MNMIKRVFKKRKFGKVKSERLFHYFYSLEVRNYGLTFLEQGVFCTKEYPSTALKEITDRFTGQESTEVKILSFNLV